ncbi:MAG: iron-sulfur cluster assembly protein, partial [Parvibaculum sp.]
DRVIEALKGIRGPDLEGNIVDLGMVSDVFISDAKVYFSINVPAERAQELEPLRQAAERTVKAIPGVNGAVVSLTAERKQGSAPPPRPQPAASRMVEPTEPKVTGFVFKVQANMDANHRDRIAFMRICSGKFKRGMRLKLSSSGKTIGVHNPILFFAQDRELLDEAFAGDIIGIPNHGTIRVGDTLSETEDLTFTGIPNFAPEILRRVRLDDPMKAKHMRRALESLAEEGVTQVFKPEIGANWVVGVVGQLQLEVLASRIASEYDIKVHFEPSPYETARWVTAEDPAELKRFMEAHRGNMATDRDGAPVFMGKSAWELGYTLEKWPKVRFSATRERAPAAA